MTREEVITLIERAANELREMMKTITMPTSAAEQLQQEIDAHEIAISALRQQDVTDTNVESNDPLTLDELRKMDGEPVWVQSPGIPEYGRWAIVEGGERIACFYMMILLAMTTARAGWPTARSRRRITMIKHSPCKRCDGRGFIKSTFNYICPDCNGSGFYLAQMTNADRIRAMSDEELSGFLMKLMGHAQCFAEGIFPYHPCPQNQNCKQCGIEWLQQPAEEDDHA